MKTVLLKGNIGGMVSLPLLSDAHMETKRYAGASRSNWQAIAALQGR